VRSGHEEINLPSVSRQIILGGRFTVASGSRIVKLLATKESHIPPSSSAL
jgi:hypothetical protein